MRLVAHIDYIESCYMPGQAQKANTIGQEVWSLETKNVRKLLQGANPTAVIITVLILISLGIAEISYMGTKDSLEKIQCKSGDAKVCQKVIDDDASIRNENKWIASLSKTFCLCFKAFESISNQNGSAPFLISSKVLSLISSVR